MKFVDIEEARRLLHIQTGLARKQPTIRVPGIGKFTRDPVYSTRWWGDRQVGDGRLGVCVSGSDRSPDLRLVRHLLRGSGRYLAMARIATRRLRLQLHPRGSYVLVCSHVSICGNARARILGIPPSAFYSFVVSGGHFVGRASPFFVEVRDGRALAVKKSDYFF